MTNTDELIKRMRENLALGFPPSPEEVSALCDAVEGAIPALDLLQARLEAGASIDKQSGRWHLFAANGNSITSGDTVRSMLQNLIFTDC